MDANAGLYLQRRADPAYVHHNRVVNTKVVVFVDARRTFFAAPVLRYAMKTLGPLWNLVVVHGTQNGDFLRAVLPGWGVKWAQIPAETIDVKALLERRGFWQGIEETRVLLINADTVVLREPPASAWTFASVGSGIPSARSSSGPTETPTVPYACQVFAETRACSRDLCAFDGARLCAADVDWVLGDAI